jgi:hypothetical protein
MEENMKHSKIIALLIFAFVIDLFLTTHSFGVPAFARRYKMSCTTCHNPFPRLKPYGDEFAGNGFIIPEEEKARDYISAGDDLLWLNRDFPLAVRMEAYGVYEEDRKVETDLQSPWGLKFMSGGTLYKNIGYYFYFYMSERGEVAGIEDAYIHFNNVGGSNLDIMVGQFQTSDPLMKRELRLTFEDYMIYTSRIGDSQTNLAYDRGVMLVYGIPQTGTDLIGMIVNGNGKQEAGGDRKFDIDSKKNIGFRVNQAIGKIASIGGFYYTGKEVDSRDVENEITYYGPDITLGFGYVDFTGQYLIREDSNPVFVTLSPSRSKAVRDVETQGIVLEAIIAPRKDRSRYYFTLLYNQIDSDFNNYDYESLTFSSTYLLSRNLRLLAEYTRNMEFEINKFSLGFVSGF